MEVGDHCVHHLKFITGIDKNPAVTGKRLQLPTLCCSFQAAHCGCTHCHHTPTACFGSSNRITGTLRHFKPLGMHTVIFNIIYPDWLKGAGTHM